MNELFLSTDFIDRVFPAPEPTDKALEEAEAWSRKQKAARSLREAFEGHSALTFQIWQYYVIDGYSHKKIACLLGVTKQAISYHLCKLKPPRKGG